MEREHDVNGYLFVYGTLMPEVEVAYGRPMRDRLLREARRLGPATSAGSLYDLGQYPGLVDHGSSLVPVHGELLLLADPGATLEWLDRYENIVPGKATNEYARVERPVLPADADQPLLAWTYVYQWPVDGARLVTDGRWR